VFTVPYQQILEGLKCCEGRGKFELLMVAAWVRAPGWQGNIPVSTFPAHQQRKEKQGKTDCFPLQQQKLGCNRKRDS